MRNLFLKSLIPALSLAALPVLPATSFAGVSIGVSINIAPPALPVYVQPPIPAVGYIWTPGYWAWADDGYYWVPGTWVLPPAVGLLWTPGYWGWSNGVYIWNAGYWGPHVGFYGGVNYGFGYTGVGFAGGYWRNGGYYYNRAYANLGSVHVTNVYNKTVINNVTINRVSYNGGRGGLTARPTAREIGYEHQRRFDGTPLQSRHQELAAKNRELRADVNHGRPAIAATARPEAFSGRGVVPARAAGGPMHDAPGRSDRPQGAREGRVAGGNNAPHGEMRTDRPPSAQQHAAGGFPGNSGGPRNEVRNDRPSTVQQHPGGAPSGGNPARNEMRNDRPPSAQQRSNFPGSPNASRGEMRNDRPPAAQQHPGSFPGGGNGPGGNGPRNEMRNERPAPNQHPGGAYSGGMSTATRYEARADRPAMAEQQRSNPFPGGQYGSRNDMRAERPSGATPGYPGNAAPRVNETRAAPVQRQEMRPVATQGPRAEGRVPGRPQEGHREEGRRF